MSLVIDSLNRSNMKPQVVQVRSGDTVRVHQRVREGSKERVQVFQGLVIKTSKQGGHLNRITVRRVSGGVGVEKSFLMHSPLIVKVEVTKRSKVRRNYLAYMRDLTGKAARLSGIEFDRQAVNETLEVSENVLLDEVSKPDIETPKTKTPDEDVEAKIDSTETEAKE